MNENKWFLHGGRGSGRTFKLLCEVYENKIAEQKRDKQKLRAELRTTRNNLKVKDVAYHLTKEELSCVVTDLNTFKSEAKELIENIIRVTWGEGWNYSLDWKVKAEQFLKEIE